MSPPQDVQDWTQADPAVSPTLVFRQSPVPHSFGAGALILAADYAPPASGEIVVDVAVNTAGANLQVSFDGGTGTFMAMNEIGNPIPTLAVVRAHIQVSSLDRINFQFVGATNTYRMIIQFVQSVP